MVTINKNIKINLIFIFISFVLGFISYIGFSMNIGNLFLIPLLILFIIYIYFGLFQYKYLNVSNIPKILILFSIYPGHKCIIYLFDKKYFITQFHPINFFNNKVNPIDLDLLHKFVQLSNKYSTSNWIIFKSIIIICWIIFFLLLWKKREN